MIEYTCVYTQVVGVWQPRVWTDATVEEETLINEGVHDNHCQLVNTPCALITVPQLVTN